MGRKIDGWKIIEPKHSVEEDSKATLDNLLRDCGYKPCKSFLTNVNNGSINNKKELIKKMGGVEVYTILSQLIEPTDKSYYLEFVAEINSLRWKVSTPGNELFEEIGLLRDIITRTDKEDDWKIAHFKDKWGELEFVSRLRDRLPKISKVISNILTYILKKYNVYNDYSSHIPIILNTLGSVKSKQYILVLSTLPSAIYSASVSKYFNSCYDIRDHGHGYCASVSYLAQDDKVAIMKVFEDNETNREKLDMGVGVLSSSRDALARRFVFLHKTRDEENSTLSLGKCYPNANIMDGLFLGKELYKLFVDNSLTNEEIVTTKSEESRYFSNKISYSKWFRGYEDLLEKGGIAVSKNAICESEDFIKNEKGMVVGNKGLYQIDTGLYVKYTSSENNIGYFYTEDDDEY